jgi:hypothetical protein
MGGLAEVILAHRLRDRQNLVGGQHLAGQADGLAIQRGELLVQPGPGLVVRHGLDLVEIKTVGG